MLIITHRFYILVPPDFTFALYNFRVCIDKMRKVYVMKVKVIRNVTYGTLIAGALIMLFAATLPVFADHMVAFMYLGGAIGVLGMVFCITLLQFQPCPGCRDYIVIQKIQAAFCPCCQEELQ